MILRDKKFYQISQKFLAQNFLHLRHSKWLSKLILLMNNIVFRYTDPMLNIDFLSFKFNRRFETYGN